MITYGKYHDSVADAWRAETRKVRRHYCRLSRYRRIARLTKYLQITEFGPDFSGKDNGDTE